MPQGGFGAEGGLDASGLRFAVVVARFNGHITEKLHDGCRQQLVDSGLADDNIETMYVPGCFELPLAAKELAGSRRLDAVICLGAIIRGGTPHFEYVSAATAHGIQRAALETNVPVIFGVLTTDNEEQALARIGGADGHKGQEAALTAIEMAHAMRNLKKR